MAKLYANDTKDANVSFNYKIMGSTPDTSVTVRGSNSVNNGSGAAVHVWRGADQTTPMDVASTTAIGINGANFDSPSITPITSGAYVISAGLGSANSTPVPQIAPTGYSNMVMVTATGSITSAVIGVASKAWISGAENPAAWSGGASAVTDSWGAASIAIRPAPAPSLTLSGTIYTDEGIAVLNSAGKVIMLRVGTATPSIFSTTTIAGTGFYQFNGITGFDAGIPMHVWVDGDTSFRAFSFTKASSSANNITNLDLYQNRIIVKNEGGAGTTTSNAELGLYDGDNANSIQFTSNTNNFVSFAGQKLLVAYGTEYAPGGTVTTNSSSTAAAPSGDFALQNKNGTSSIITLGGTLSIAGSYFASSSSIMNPKGYGVLFTATTTGKVIAGTLTGSAAFASTTFSGQGGAWAYKDNASSTGNFIIGAGTVTATTGLMTIGGNYSNLGTFTAGSGTTTLSGTTQQTLSGTMTGTSAFKNLEFLNTSASTTFAAAASTTGNFYDVTPGTKIEFMQGVTTTAQNFIIGGSSGNEINLFSASAGTRFNIYVPGTYSVSYARVKDSDACSTSGGISATNSFDNTNNVCWTITGGGNPNQTLIHYRWRNDDGTEVAATYAAPEDAPIAATSSMYKGDRRRLRLTVSNAGSADATNITYRLEYASSSCTSWLPVPSYNTQTTEEWVTDLSGYLPEAAVTTHSSGMSVPPGKTFTSGEARLFINQTSAITLTTSQSTEIEYGIRSTSFVQSNILYCFRLTNAGSVTNFTYSAQPQVSLNPNPRPQYGGTGTELPGSGVAHAGGVQSGGAPVEPPAVGVPVAGGVQSGGGGDSG